MNDEKKIFFVYKRPGQKWELVKGNSENNL